MKAAGGLLIGLGALLVLFAFDMDTTVFSAGTLIGGEYVGGGSSHNLGLLQQQMMALHTGLATFIAGAVLYGFGATVEATQTAARTGSELSPEEIEEDWEREERLAGVRRINIIMGIVTVGSLLVMLFLFRDVIAT